MCPVTRATHACAPRREQHCDRGGRQHERGVGDHGRGDAGHPGRGGCAAAGVRGGRGRGGQAQAHTPALLRWRRGRLADHACVLVLSERDPRGGQRHLCKGEFARGGCGAHARAGPAASWPTATPPCCTSCWHVGVAQLAQSARVPVILDAGGVDEPIGHDLLTNVDILSPNETELLRLTGACARAWGSAVRVQSGAPRPACAMAGVGWCSAARAACAYSSHAPPNRHPRSPLARRHAHAQREASPGGGRKAGAQRCEHGAGEDGRQGERGCG